MVKLNFSMRGFGYESGVECLRDSFIAAAHGIQNKVPTESEVRESQSGDYAIDPQHAEDGATLFDPDNLYFYRIEVI